MAAFHSFFTIVLFLIFIGIVVWAYSKKRKPDFDAAARLPFADEETTKNNGGRS
jgi:cytochrome c oxidase cbb3-type subunit 4